MSRINHPAVSTLKATLPYTLPLTCILLITACMDSNKKPAPSVTSTANQQDEQFIPKLAALKTLNPVADAQQAISTDKHYFLCNVGRSATVPGLTPDVYNAAKNNCPTRCLDGVTDAIYGRNHAKYLGAAIAYSASWNQVMINVCDT